ncbi:MAG: VOC family protein [Planctomycetota bacterium]|jgi:hypothetical protein
MEDEIPGNPIVVFVSDLIFRTKITSTAGALGANAIAVRSVDQLREQFAFGVPSMVMVDLDADDGVAAVELAVEASRQSRDQERTGGAGGYRVVAFVSHVNQHLADQAGAHGADIVMPRSQFTGELPDLIRSALQNDWDS